MTTAISVLLPTRGRPESLERSLRTLMERAKDPSQIEILFGIDNDDTETLAYCENTIQPWLDSIGTHYTTVQFKRLGYGRLNDYLNTLFNHCEGRWIFFYNDDAVMETEHWDQVVVDHDNEFALLRAETNHEHPYAIFPIMPRKWVELVGHISLHQLNDAWVSQIAWMLDIVKTIPVMITHERFDLTGKNNDATFSERPIYEGNVNDPKDFNYVTYRTARQNESRILAEYLKSQGHELTHYYDSLAGKADIWHKMLAIDKKGAMMRYN